MGIRKMASFGPISEHIPYHNLNRTMNPFLKQTAQYLCSAFQSDLEDLCVVLPNRRAGLFLRKYLALEVGKVSWAPSILSIEDFITEISGLHEVDQAGLLFELYEVHREIEGDKTQPFDEFLHWAQQLIGDFNDIDRYMADSHELFSTLSEARAISLWNLDGKPLTPFEQEYLRFYQSLDLYYQKFSARMLAKNQGWQGLIFRKVAENIDQIKDRMTWKHVIFAGLNALTKAEEQLIGVLRNNGMATLLWDADGYYFHDGKQEAGEFLRKWMKKWPVQEMLWVSDDYARDAKEIVMIGSPDPVGQVKYCGKLLGDLARMGKADEKTAVVLPDISLLMPLLNSVPSEVASLNITAGLPLKQTPLAGLFDTIFNMHLHASRYSNYKTSEKHQYYYKDVLKMIQHPYIQLIAEALMDGGRMVLADLTEKIRLGAKSFINFKDVSGEQIGLFGMNLAFLETVFNFWKGPSDAITCFKNLIEDLRISILKLSQKGKLKKDPTFQVIDRKMDMEYLFAFSTILHQLSNLLNNFNGNLKITAFFELFQQLTNSMTLPFSGEPLQGVQLMGMLETRNLDFENLIILSCNEDLLPASKLTPSFIPFDIKRNFGLPTYRQKDSVYAYHFYRLLQRATNVWILYNTEPNQLGGGDRSRFLRQIVQELPGHNPKISIIETVLTSPIVKGEPTRRIIISKVGKILVSLEAKALKGFSATSLNLYRNCPLKFYYSEIAGIKEPEEISDTIDSAVLGSAVHGALNDLYQQFIGMPLSVGKLKEALSGVDKATLNAFDKKYKGGDILSGKNLLLVNVAKLLVSRLLNFDIREEEVFVRDSKQHHVSFLEQHIKTSLIVPFGNNQITVNLKGFLDRVDNVDGLWKIIDYKTGSTEAKNINIKDWEDLKSNPDLDIGFQLVMYGFLMLRWSQEIFRVSAGIVSLRKIKSGFNSVSVPSDETGKSTTILTADSAEKFQTVLLSILSDIYDPTKPFIQTDSLNNCNYCPYASLCGR